MAPVTGVVERLIEEPEHTGELLVGVGDPGVVLTTTVAVPATEVQPPTVTVKLYVPAIAAVTPVRVGFCVLLLYEPGPVHAHVAPLTAGVLRLSDCPVQAGELVVTLGVEGVGLTVMVIALDVAGLPVTPDKFEVITQVTTWPLVRPEVVYVEAVAPPTFVPLICHW